MIQGLPGYISIVFLFTTLLTLSLFYIIVKDSKLHGKDANMIFAGTLLWMIVQAIATYSNFYNINTHTNPPRFVLLVLPPFLLIILIFLNKNGRAVIDSLSLKKLTYIHTVRILVEVVLYWLYLYKAIPELMTFSGRNFDILVGISAPIIAYFGFIKKALNIRAMLIWNLVGLALLVNIVVNAILSSPVSFQKFAFDQPNIAVTHFPFSWLPCFIVPVVLFCHLVSIRKLLYNKS